MSSTTNTRSIQSEAITVQALLASASAETGLNDFGNGGFRQAFAAYVERAATVGLSEQGKAFLKADVQRLLVNRLRFADDLKRHPEILDEDVSDPVVVMGLPRTGTSKMQRMLSARPGVHRLEYWKTRNPAPFRTEAGQAILSGANDPRIADADQAVDFITAAMPELVAAHPTSTREADEESYLMQFTFSGPASVLALPVNDYAELPRGSLSDTYRYIKNLLHYLQWQEGGRLDQAWVLKSPWHIGNIDSLIEHFPKATIVMTHRNVHEALPSYCRLHSGIWAAYIDHVDPLVLGRVILDSYADEMCKHLHLRQALATRCNIIDIAYTELRDDPIPAVRRVYAQAGRPLAAEDEQAIVDWCQRDEHQGKRSYSYGLDEYGLTRQTIDVAFRDYNLMFKHLLERQ